MSTSNSTITNEVSVNNTDSKLAAFLKEVESHVGENSRWTWKTMGWEGEWCCAFVMACAKTVGILNKIIPNTFSCTTLAGYGGDGKLGSKFIKGSRHGNNIKPQPGDLILFNWENSGGIYDSDHVGIVVEVIGDTIHSVEGNTVTYNMYTSKVAKKEYNYTRSIINGYFRPDWKSVGSSVSDLPSFGLSSCIPLYNTQNTRSDAVLREVAYIKDYKYSVSAAGIKLSVVNYTGMLSALFSDVTSNSSGNNVTVDGIENQNAKIIIEYLMDKGLNAAAAVGICANIKHESGYRTDIIEYGYTFSNGGVGLCQWTNYPRSSPTGRKTDMVKMAGGNWRNNLTGQLNYLWYELNNSYSYVLEFLKTVNNTESGAMSAADYFVRKFEVPADIDNTSKVRQASAAELFGQLAIKQISTSSGVKV